MTISEKVGKHELGKRQSSNSGIKMALQSISQRDEPLDLPFSKLSHLQYFYKHLSSTSRILFWTQWTVSPCTTFKINDLPLHKNWQWSIIIEVLCKFSSVSTFICSSVSCLIYTMCISLHDNNYYSYSHRILTMTSLVKGFPTPLSAVHL